jgi:hypothetical protein
MVSLLKECNSYLPVKMIYVKKNQTSIIFDLSTYNGKENQRQIYYKETTCRRKVFPRVSGVILLLSSCQ